MAPRPNRLSLSSFNQNQPLGICFMRCDLQADVFIAEGCDQYLIGAGSHAILNQVQDDGIGVAADFIPPR